MTELDPYAVLGVARTAPREEIARAYRLLAKQHHPDAGAPPSPTMARINEAWRILSDPIRRARWDRAHALPVPPHWPPPASGATRRPAPAPPAARASSRDSGWLALGVVAGAAIAVAAVMMVVNVVSPSQAAAPAGVRFESGGVAFRYPEGWQIAAGEDVATPRVLAHLVSFDPGGDRMCTRFEEDCEVTGGEIPAGEASVLFTVWQGGTPPVPNPVTRRPYGLDAARIIGDAPAAFRFERTRDAAVGWWQLSPPDFPQRWIEVHAEMSGGPLEQERLLDEIDDLLQTLEFTDG